MDVALEPFEMRLRSVVSRLQVAGPVATMRIAEHVNQPVRTVRHYLRRMESVGVVCRPDGVKSGYATSANLPYGRWQDDKAIARQLDDVDIALLTLLDRPLTTVEISRRSDIARSTAGYHLRKLEKLNLVERPYGVRSGYIATCGQTVLPLAKALRVYRELTPFRLRILKEFAGVNRGVRIKAKYLQQVFDIPERTMRYHLKALDDLGVIERRSNRKLGYAAVQPLAHYVVELSGEVQ